MSSYILKQENYGKKRCLIKHLFHKLQNSAAFGKAFAAAGGHARPLRHKTFDKRRDLGGGSHHVGLHAVFAQRGGHGFHAYGPVGTGGGFCKLGLQIITKYFSAVLWRFSRRPLNIGIKSKNR